MRNSFLSLLFCAILIGLFSSGICAYPGPGNPWTPEKNAEPAPTVAQTPCTQRPSQNQICAMAFATFAVSTGTRQPSGTPTIELNSIIVRLGSPPNLNL